MSKIKYPSVVLGSKAYCEGFTNAIKHIRELNKDTQEDHNTDHLLGTIGSLTRRVQELEKQNEELKQQAGYCVDEGCEHSHILHKCCSGAQLSDRAVDAIIADVMKPDGKWMVKLAPEPTAADLKLQADLKAVTQSVKAVGEAVHTIAERMRQPGGLLYRGLK